MADDRRQQLADDVTAVLACYQQGFIKTVSGRLPVFLQPADVLADALLPLLDRVAADAAAEALEAAADELHVHRFNADKDPDARWPVGCDQKPDLFYAGITTARGHLRARAAELRAPARTDEEN